MLLTLSALQCLGALQLAPRASSRDGGEMIRVQLSGGALPANARCIFALPTTPSDAVCVASDADTCLCPSPATDLVGDATIFLTDNAGVSVDNATLTFYADSLPPSLHADAPQPPGASCAGGGSSVAVRVSNAAPTSALRCEFGGLGVSIGVYVGASLAPINGSVGEVQCPVPASALLGDVRLRLSNDGGARWSQPSAEPFTCHDATRAPVPLSLSPTVVDVAVGPDAVVSGANGTVAVRALNLRRGSLLCRWGGATLAGGVLLGNGSVLNVTLAPAPHAVGIARCDFPSSLGGRGGTLGLALSSDGGVTWSAEGAAAEAPTLVAYDSRFVPRVFEVTPRSLPVLRTTAGLASPRRARLTLRGVNFGPGNHTAVLAGAAHTCTLLAAPWTNLSAVAGEGYEHAASLSCEVDVPSMVGSVPLSLRGPPPLAEASAPEVVLYDPAAPPNLLGVSPTSLRLRDDAGQLDVHTVTLHVCNVPWQSPTASDSGAGPDAVSLLCGLFAPGGAATEPNDEHLEHAVGPAHVSRAVLAAAAPAHSSPSTVEAAACTAPSQVTCEVRGVSAATTNASAAIRLSHDGGLSWSSASATLAFWSLTALGPNSGPSTGNTSVMLLGDALPRCSNATGCTCRFEHAGTAVNVAADTVVEGTHCLSPPASAFGAIESDAVLRVRVSYAPDGATYSTEAVNFSYFSPPVVTNLSVPLLPLLGGPVVTLHGRGYDGADGGTANGSARCGFGSASVSASRVSDTVLRCVAPSAAAARATAGELRLDLGLREASLPSGGQLHNEAQATLSLSGVAKVAAGELVLTTSNVIDVTGGAWIVPAAAHPALTDFELCAEVRVGGGSEADGLRVSYGPPESEGDGATGPVLGEMGGIVGLVVRLRTFTHQRVELVVDGAIVGSASTAGFLQNDPWVPLNLSVSAAGGVVVTYRSHQLLRVPHLPPSYAAQPHWRVGFGARNGDLASNHRVRSIRLRSALLAARTTVAVEVSLNGGADFSSGGPSLAYVSSPRLTSLRPLAAPTAGGTVLMLRGQALCLGARPHQCRFGTLSVVANSSGCDESGDTLDPALPTSSPSGVWRWPAGPPSPPVLVAHGALSCVAPPSANASGPAAVSLTLDPGSLGWVDSGQSLLYYDSVAWAAVDPQSGPTAGGAIVRVTASGARSTLEAIVVAGGAADVRCSFGDVHVHASVQASAEAVLCAAPAGHGAVAVRVSLNAQQFEPSAAFTGANLTFEYFPPLAAFTMQPTQGPTMGGTQVTLRSSSSPSYISGANRSELLCRFGYATVPASVADSHSSVRCTAPHAHLALAPPLLAQQRYAGGVSALHSFDGALELNFSDQHAVENATVQLLGAATIHGGVLRLTDSDRLHNALNGTFLVTPQPQRPPLTHLSVAFDLHMTRSPAPAASAPSALGFCVSFGDIGMLRSLPCATAHELRSLRQDRAHPAA